MVAYRLSSIVYCLFQLPLDTVRIDDHLFDLKYSVYAIPLVILALLIAAPVLLRHWQRLGVPFAGLLFLGLLIRPLQIVIPGAGQFGLSVIPAIAILHGFRTAIGAAALLAFLGMLFGGVPPAFAGNFLLNGILLPAFALSSYTSFNHRLRERWQPVSAALGTWFGLIACAVLAAFAVPLIGRALWGIFAPAMATGAVFHGIYEGLFTGVLVYLYVRFYRSQAREHHL